MSYFNIPLAYFFLFLETDADSTGYGRAAPSQEHSTLQAAPCHKKVSNQ